MPTLITRTKKTKALWTTKGFGLVLGLGVFVIVGWWAFLSPWELFRWADRSLADRYFQLRLITSTFTQHEGTTVRLQDEALSDDILILGVDDRSLETLGRWPFSRSLHADLLNSLSRVQNQVQRERAVFLDFFFLDREAIPENDLALARAIEENQRVFVETIYSDADPGPEAGVHWDRLRVLLDSGTLKVGEGRGLPGFSTVQAPLIPFAEASAGSGFATFTPDHDQVFRRQALVSKVVRVLEQIPLEDLRPDEQPYLPGHVRYQYTSRSGHEVDLPTLTPEVVRSLPELLKREALPRQVESDAGVVEVFSVKKVQDIFLPSMPLALALAYWHKTPADAEVVLGSHIRIPDPELFDAETGLWHKAGYPEVRIPIDATGAMTINYRGPGSSESSSEYQTFPVRSYSSYATRAPGADPSSWPETRQLGGKILLVGPFSSGMADDEKNTPYGQMYGVEMHANALNTILTRNFLVPVPSQIAALVLLVSILLVAFLTSRTSTLLSFLVTLVLLAGAFVAALVLFESSWVYPYSSLFVGVLSTFLVVVVYRALTEEREKRNVRSTFGKYVSPEVVTQLLAHPPELGGVDRDLTVLFSDIRGFTSLSEVMTPQELVGHLNLYLTAMTDVIHEYHGTLDKYVGDEIMCFWGAPLEQADHARLAAQCALRMMEVLGELNQTWPEDRRIDIGIGLNSGLMTVGNMGSPGRMNYTLMGDNVNLGARLEGTNKEYLTNVIISESTHQRLGPGAIVRELDLIRVKGKQKAVTIYELLDFEGGLTPPPRAR